MTEQPDWIEPRVTGNSQLLLGAVTGIITRYVDEHPGPDTGFNYEVVGLDPDEGQLILQHTLTKNRYVLSIRQSAGREV
jgi:hypothetical protein